jgi:hypothetical protein
MLLDTCIPLFYTPESWKIKESADEAGFSESPSVKPRWQSGMAKHSNPVHADRAGTKNSFAFVYLRLLATECKKGTIRFQLARWALPGASAGSVHPVVWQS